MAETSLGPWKLVRVMGSASHRELIVVPGQEANGDNSLFDLLYNNGILHVLIRIASRRF